MGILVWLSHSSLKGLGSRVEITGNQNYPRNQYPQSFPSAVWLLLSPRGDDRLVFWGIYIKKCSLLNSQTWLGQWKMFMPGATGDLGQTGVPLIMITGGGGGCTLTRKTHGQIPLYWCSCLTNYLSFYLFVCFVLFRARRLGFLWVRACTSKVGTQQVNMHECEGRRDGVWVRW